MGEQRSGLPAPPCACGEYLRLGTVQGDNRCSGHEPAPHTCSLGAEKGWRRRMSRSDQPHLDRRRTFTAEGRRPPFKAREEALTHQELNESYKRFKRRITQRRKREVPPASTPWTPRGRREPGYELDPVRHRLQLDSPPGPRKQAVTCRDVQVAAGGESSFLANVKTSHTSDARGRLSIKHNLNQEWLWRSASPEHTDACGTGCEAKRCDLKPFAVVEQKSPKTLAAPMLLDDYYSNLLDCSCSNLLALALGSSVHIWNADTCTVVGHLEPGTEGESISSLCWSEDGRTLGVGTRRGQIQLWDVERKRTTTCLLPHSSVVRAVSWNQHLLSSGSALGRILHHDPRAPAPLIGSAVQEGLCSLRWSPEGERLASGSTEGLLSIWDGGTAACTRMCSPVSTMKQPSAVKAMAWCPWRRNTIATGGGYKDGKLRIWDAASGTAETVASTSSQICSLRWAERRRCLLTGHGLPRHQVACWSWDFPRLSLTSRLTGHSQRVLHVALNSENTQIFSAGADQRLCVWDM